MTITDGYAPLPLTDDLDDSPFEQEPDTDTDLGFEADTTDDADAPDTQKTKRPGRGTRTPTKVTARTVRAVLAKHTAIASASDEELSLLASMLGVKAHAEDLVAHILSTPRLSLAGVSELESIVGAARIDPFDAVAVAMQHEAQSKPIWGILSAVGLLDGARPSKDGDASVAIARAAGKFGPEHEQKLDAVKALAHKGY